MKHALLAAAIAATIVAPHAMHGAEDLPKPIQFARYEPMMNRSPFAVASAPVVAPPAAPNFAKDWYVANAARSPEGDLVTIASSTDKNFKEYLTTKECVKGICISNVEWSDKVGATKVTLSKDGQFATLTFNQALLTQPIANAPGAQPQPQPQPGQAQPVAQPPVGLPNSGLPTPAGPVPGTNTIKPAPIPTLPTPPPRVRSVIQRNPTVPQPAATPDLNQE